MALDVSETIRKGKKVKLGEILLKNGYSLRTSLRPSLVTETKSYQSIMKPLAQQLKSEIDRLALEISSRDISKERYEILAKSLDILNKNYQLATGGLTENTKVSFEISEKLAHRLKLDDIASNAE